MEQWLAVADEIRRGRCNVETLDLTMLSGTARSIRLDRNLTQLAIAKENGFTDEAGVALAQALTVNRTIRKITVKTVQTVSYEPLLDTDKLGTSTYEAFSAMLRANTSINIVLHLFRHTGDGDRVESHNQMIIEQRLNIIGRGRLLASSNHTTREEWVKTLHELSALKASDCPTFVVGCLYSLLRLNPSICMLEVNATSESSE